MVFGSPYKDNVNIHDEGEAYAFALQGEKFMEDKKLTANDGAFNDYFGSSVATSGYTLLVGS